MNRKRHNCGMAPRRFAVDSRPCAFPIGVPMQFADDLHVPNVDREPTPDDITLVENASPGECHPRDLPRAAPKNRLVAEALPPNGTDTNRCLPPARLPSSMPPSPRIRRTPPPPAPTILPPPPPAHATAPSTPPSTPPSPPPHSSRGSLPSSLTLEESLLSPSSSSACSLPTPASQASASATSDPFGASGERTRTPPRDAPSGSPPAASFDPGRDGSLAATETPRHRGTRSRTVHFSVGVVCIAAMLAALVTAGASRMRPRNGRVAMFIAGENKMALDYFQVVVDGQKRCDTRPCVLNLDAGTHALVAQAEGYSPHEVEIAIEPGSSLALNVTLRRDRGARKPRLSGP